MTADESTPDKWENVTESIDYERLGRETAAAELERSALRVETVMREASEKAESGDLTAADIEKVMKELATAKVWLARIVEGSYVEAHDVLD